MGQLVPPPPWASEKEWDRYLNHTKHLWMMLKIGVPLAIIIGVVVALFIK